MRNDCLGYTGCIMLYMRYCGGTISIVTLPRQEFFDFLGFEELKSKDTDPDMIIRLLKNIGRNIKATGLCFLLGITLSALFQRYIPADVVSSLFGSNEGFRVLMAATIGVPLYACGGGTIPLLIQLLITERG